MSKDIPTSIRMSSELKEALKELAKQDGRSLSSYVERVLVEHIAQAFGKKKKA